MKVIDFKDFPDESTPICADKLNELQELMLKAIYPVGSYYETSDKSFDPNVYFGGTWVLDNDGTVLVSKSEENDSLFNKNLGTIVGEENHVLQRNEMAAGVALTREAEAGEWSLGTWESHNQTQKMWSANLQGQNGAPNGGSPISLVQPSKIINRWHRKA